MDDNTVSLMIEFKPEEGGDKGRFPLGFRPATDHLFGIEQVITRGPFAVPVFEEDGGSGFFASTFLVAVRVPVGDVAALLSRVNQSPKLVAVHLDPVLYHRADPVTDCKVPYLGGSGDVRSQIGTEWLRERGMEGQGVLIAIVDSGFNFAHVQSHHPGVKLDKALSRAVAIGEAAVESHGTMSAVLATVAAPQATLIDVASDDGVSARCSSAMEAYKVLAEEIETAELLTRFSGLVVSNSWQTGEIRLSGIPKGTCRADGLPTKRIGVISPDQPCHLINRTISQLAAAGADFVFAAGNSGKCNPVSEEGTIFGPNGNPDVLTVAALDLQHRRLSNSSHGPGAQDPKKPDVSGYSNFDLSKTLKPEGSTTFVDRDTSASAALVAGIVAALRSGLGPPGRGPTPADLRQQLRDAAKRELVRADGTGVTLTGWDREFGWGAVRVEALSISPNLRPRGLLAPGQGADRH